MLVDSHCHLNFIDLTPFDNSLQNVLDQARKEDVEHMLSVCVELDDYPQLQKIAEDHLNVSISVGVHPNSEMTEEVTSEQLISLANAHPVCIAIGETGLDYYRTSSDEARDIQQSRFREHIRAAIRTQKPLIIHTRDAAEDTLRIMAEENAQHIGGVMHCFAESLEVAKQAIDLNFYISFSGIVTFKNAKNLQMVARQIPLERILIETDSPYLAPVPYRGKQNHPALVKHTALFLAELLQIEYRCIAETTTHNFYRCFNVSRKS